MKYLYIHNIHGWLEKVRFCHKSEPLVLHPRRCAAAAAVVIIIYLTGTLIQPLAKAMAKMTKGVDIPNIIMYGKGVFMGFSPFLSPAVCQYLHCKLIIISQHSQADLWHSVNSRWEKSSVRKRKKATSMIYSPMQFNAV